MPLQSHQQMLVPANKSTDATSSTFLVSAHLKAFGYLGGDISDVERASLEHLSTSPIYVEVVAPKGSSAGQTEARILYKFIPQESAYRLAEEDRIGKDDAYKSQLLNYLLPKIRGESDTCERNVECVGDWLSENINQTNKDCQSMYFDALQEGCLQVGGCRAEVMNTLIWHASRGNSVLFQSTGEEYKYMQSRLQVINAGGNYKMKTLAIVALKYSTVRSRYEEKVRGNIVNFLKSPKQSRAPRIFDPEELSQFTVEFICAMNDMLSCLSGTSTVLIDSYGVQRPCEPMVDSMMIFDNTEHDGYDGAAVALKGGNEKDKGFLNARLILKKAMPHKAEECHKKTAKQWK